MLFPDIHPHFFACEDWGGAYSIEIDEDELPNDHTKLFKAEEP